PPHEPAFERSNAPRCAVATDSIKASSNSFRRFRGRFDAYGPLTWDELLTRTWSVPCHGRCCPRGDGGARRLNCSLHARSHPSGVRGARVLAEGSEQHHDNSAPFDHGLEDEASAGFCDVTRFLDDDVPGRIRDQGASVCEV